MLYGPSYFDTYFSFQLHHLVVKEQPVKSKIFSDGPRRHGQRRRMVSPQAVAVCVRRCIRYLVRSIKISCFGCLC